MSQLLVFLVSPLFILDSTTGICCRGYTELWICLGKETSFIIHKVYVFLVS